jgi:hypothetical protein
MENHGEIVTQRSSSLYPCDLRLWNKNKHEKGNSFKTRATTVRQIQFSTLTTSQKMGLIMVGANTWKQSRERNSHW